MEDTENGCQNCYIAEDYWWTDLSTIYSLFYAHFMFTVECYIISTRLLS